MNKSVKDFADEHIQTIIDGNPDDGGQTEETPDDRSGGALGLGSDRDPINALEACIEPEIHPSRFTLYPYEHREYLVDGATGEMWLIEGKRRELVTEREPTVCQKQSSN